MMRLMHSNNYIFVALMTLWTLRALSGFSGEHNTFSPKTFYTEQNDYSSHFYMPTAQGNNNVIYQNISNYYADMNSPRPAHPPIIIQQPQPINFTRDHHNNQTISTTTATLRFTTNPPPTIPPPVYLWPRTTTSNNNANVETASATAVIAPDATKPTNNLRKSQRIQAQQQPQAQAQAQKNNKRTREAEDNIQEKKRHKKASAPEDTAPKTDNLNQEASPANASAEKPAHQNIPTFSIFETPQNFRCPLENCASKYTRLSDLRNHFALKHSDKLDQYPVMKTVGKYSCLLCGQKFARKKARDSHVRAERKRAKKAERKRAKKEESSSDVNDDKASASHDQNGDTQELDESLESDDDEHADVYDDDYETNALEDEINKDDDDESMVNSDELEYLNQKSKPQASTNSLRVSNPPAIPSNNNSTTRPRKPSSLEHLLN